MKPARKTVAKAAKATKRPPKAAKKAPKKVSKKTPKKAAKASARPARKLAHVKGEVDPFNGDYREAIAMVNQFVASLLTLPNVEAVNVVEMPLDLGSDAALRGSAEAQTGKAPFELRVVIRDKIRESS